MSNSANEINQSMNKWLIKRFFSKPLPQKHTRKQWRCIWQPIEGGYKCTICGKVKKPKR